LNKFLLNHKTDVSLNCPQTAVLESLLFTLPFLNLLVNTIFVNFLQLFNANEWKHNLINVTLIKL